MFLASRKLLLYELFCNPTPLKTPGKSLKKPGQIKNSREIEVRLIKNSLDKLGYLRL
jgi:hypothetical protein